MPSQSRDDAAAAGAGATGRRDWRWVVGGIGRVLIAVGVLMFAFVAYQLWGTGIQTAQAQQRLTDQFETQLGEAPATTAPATTAPGVTVPGATVEGAAATAASGATTTTIAGPAPTTTLPAPIISAPPVGDPVARLDIAAIGIDGTIVVEGVAPDDLTKGPGHFPETPLPGQFGNAAIAGHRTTHGQPFYRIDELGPGDDIVVTTLAGRYVYVVTGTVIVGPDDYGLVIPAVDPSKATLVLTSCHPRFSARQRIVVSADLDPGRSDLVTLGTGAQAAFEAATGATSTTLAPTTTVAELTPTPDGQSPATPPTTPPTTPPATETPTATGGSSGVELFENRWFSDPDAFTDVALWGIVLTVVALGAWLLSRRVGRNVVGALVGIVPFVVALYFFFENVNRLLPPNL
ncbi:MAG: class E sortase [Ilumatobacteraceae bacterium]